MLALVPPVIPKPCPKGWSVGLVRGAALDELRTAAQVAQPILTADDCGASNAQFVADPFATRVGNEWYLFCEVYDTVLNRGVIGAARSKDLESWDYLGTVLEEPHHLSYPFVFEHGGDIFMMPEARSAREVTIYRAVDFPFRWKREKTILRGRYFDASMVKHDGRYWLFVGWMNYWLRLFHAPHPLGPWAPHAFPFIRTYDKGGARPGGRPVVIDGKLIRFGQDNAAHYGHQLRAWEVTALSPRWYAERPVSREPVLQPSGAGWNAVGMHHLDLHVDDAGGWVGFVDGAPRQ